MAILLAEPHLERSPWTHGSEEAVARTPPEGTAKEDPSTENVVSEEIQLVGGDRTQKGRPSQKDAILYWNPSTESVQLHCLPLDLDPQLRG